MAIEDTYRTIVRESEGSFRDRGSKFIGYAFPVQDEERIKKHLAHLKKLHPSSRHVCYAYRINPLDEQWRANDDGEPSSSAGKPILGQIRSMELQNVLVAVVRYFGGTLLGVPGLIHAYKAAAIEALSQAEIIEKTVTKSLLLETSYADMGALMSFVKDSGFDYSNPSMEELFRVQMQIPASRWEEIHSLCASKSWLAATND